jgi:hypothetical protein
VCLSFFEIPSTLDSSMTIRWSEQKNIPVLPWIAEEDSADRECVVSIWSGWEMNQKDSALTSWLGMWWDWEDEAIYQLVGYGLSIPHISKVTNPLWAGQIRDLTDSLER